MVPKAFNGTSLKKLMSFSFDKVDVPLHQWFKSSAGGNGQHIIGAVLLKQARILAAELGYRDPGCLSRGWINRWKKRHNIPPKRILKAGWGTSHFMVNESMLFLNNSEPVEGGSRSTDDYDNAIQMEDEFSSGTGVCDNVVKVEDEFSSVTVVCDNVVRVEDEFSSGDVHASGIMPGIICSKEEEDEDRMPIGPATALKYVDELRYFFQCSDPQNSGMDLQLQYVKSEVMKKIEGF